MLKGKIAIVTGGAKGIGEGIADKLDKEGAKVFILDLVGKGNNFFKCNVSNFEEVQDVIFEIGKKFGRIDILINNAGIYPFQNLKEMKEEDWNKVIDIDLKGVFNCTKATLPFLKKGGEIVSITSIAGVKKGYIGLAHYCAAKSGIEGFTKSCALELASLGVNVNAVAPGVILTPGVMKNAGAKGIKEIVQGVPLRRAGKPKDIADAVKFLVSSEADYITGQTIVVDGGLTVQ